MVEGHAVHRLRHLFNGQVAGQVFKATSPNGRFTNGASAISGKCLRKVEAVGKNLFAFFDGDHVLHIHFGMSGRWSIFDRDDAPEPTPTTRLRLENERIVTHLSAMTLVIGKNELFESKRALLGQDPLRADADPEALWQRTSASKKTIGLLLMDQAFFAGVGNIYRAEILFKAGVHPNRKATSLSRAEFDRIWHHSVDLLQRGFAQGSILTVDKEEAERLGRPAMRRYIYNQSKCGRCQGPVKSWDMASRTCYACPSCQHVDAGDEPEGAGEVRVFQSRCARESLAERLQDPGKLSVAELRAHLGSLGADASGSKKQLIARLEEHNQCRGNEQNEPPGKVTVAVLRERLRAAGLPSSGAKAVLIKRLESAASVDAMKRERNDVAEPEEAAAALQEEGKRKRKKTKVKEEPEAEQAEQAEDRGKAPRTGTAHLEQVAVSASQAEAEKAAAGEKRNVEHVAEFDRRRSARLRK